MGGDRSIAAAIFVKFYFGTNVPLYTSAAYGVGRLSFSYCLFCVLLCFFFFLRFFSIACGTFFHGTVRRLPKDAASAGGTSNSCRKFKDHLCIRINTQSILIFSDKSGIG